MSNKFISNTYDDTGEKNMIAIPAEVEGSVLFSVKAGDTDVYSVQAQISSQAERVTIPTYKDLSGDTVGRVPPECYSIGLNINTNISADIIFQLDSQ